MAAEKHVVDLGSVQVDEKNLVMFRKKHLFVEMHELNNQEWHETHRWNYGLEEDLDKGEWTAAHLPTISVFGMMALRECLRPDLVILDVDTEEGEQSHTKKLRCIAMEIVNHLVRDGQIEPGNAASALDVLARHLCLKKCVDHDTKLKEEHEEFERKLSYANLQLGSHGHLPAAEDSRELEQSRIALWNKKEGDEVPPPPPSNVRSISEGPQQQKTEPKRQNSLRRRSSRLQKMVSVKAMQLFDQATKPRHEKQSLLVQLPAVVEDPLRPDAEEEAVHVLIDDEFNELKTDTVVVVRLSAAISSGLEEQIEYTVGDQQETKHQDLLARFIVLVLGPSSKTKKEDAYNKLQEMGAAAAALMQDDVVVRALYEARDTSDLLKAIDMRLSSMRVLPHTSRPTKSAMRSRASRMYQQLAELRRVAEEQARHRLKEVDQPPPTMVELNNTGGRFLRLEYPEQGARWGAREQSVFSSGFSVGALFSFMQKYAIPLISGIILALILANTRKGGYRRWAGASSHDDDDDDDHVRRFLSGGGDSVGHPTAFNLAIDGHDVTLHFIINDILMAFFFGLAVKEIAEAFQPGGSLYPPTRKAVNPMAGTIGGVLGPVTLYFLFVALASKVPINGDPLLSAYGFTDIARGWGIPTATDISVAWVTAVVVFGTGHPAINYLLLCAVIDDGIGLLIIAVAYPDPDNPVEPVWLLLVILAMFISWMLRKFECARWQIYVALAGPFAWFGLLYAAVHPSLALVFVVPFMPIHIDRDTQSHKDDTLSVADTVLSVRKEYHLSPLHDFEESVKGFVDFAVLFAFGAVNAGVELDTIGGFSLVIVLSLLVGKTLGMTVGSSIAVHFGYARPEGMSFRHLVVAGVISSVGLTVSLFIAGEAFPNRQNLEDQAKLGALLSVFPSLVLVALANFSPTGRRFLLGAPMEEATAMTRIGSITRHEGDLPDEENPPTTSGGLNGDGIPTPRDTGRDSARDVIDYEADYDELDEDDETLEDVVVRNIEKTLKEIHHIEQQVEKRAGVRRSSKMLLDIHDHQSCNPLPPH